MSDPSRIGEWISYGDELPLTWSVLTDAAAPAALLQSRNLRLLAVVATLEERHARGEQGGAAEAEVERLHHKVDVLLELTGAILRLHQPLPPPLPVRLSREGACWTPADDPPEVGARVHVAIHLHPCAVDPFAWTATVIRSGEEVCARFDPLGDALGAALEKHVFMHHRRSVAGQRQPGARG